MICWGATLHRCGTTIAGRAVLLRGTAGQDQGSSARKGLLIHYMVAARTTVQTSTNHQWQKKDSERAIVAEWEWGGILVPTGMFNPDVNFRCLQVL